MLSHLKLQNFPTLTIVCLAITLVRCTDGMKQFEEIPSTDTGLQFRNDITETQHTNILTYEYSYNGAGIAAGDVNHDGLVDLYFAGNAVPNKLFINAGGWKFRDITAVSKTAGRNDWKTGVTMADVNGDGWLDIYVCYSGNAPGEGYNLPVVKEYPNRANQLFINNGCEPGGTPAFTEQSKEYGIDANGTFSTQAYFFDYDLDGDLDMFLVNHANMFYAAFFNTNRLRNLRHPYFGNKLYRNDSDGTADQGNQKTHFTDVSAAAGIHGSGLNFGLSAAISDINDDGWPDIYVTNDYEEQDFCYINNRDGTFREASHTMFGHLSKFGMGSDVADMNNDGLQELLVLDMLPEDNKRQKLLKGPDEYDRYTLATDSGYHHQYMRNTLQLNRGFAADSLPRFSEIGQLAGVSNTDWSWSPFIIDLDNDGLKDIFITNGYLRDFTNLDFMKYTSTVYENAKVANKAVDYLNLIQGLPQTRLTNYFFRNKDGLQFEDVSGPWGLTRKAVSNGAIYADIDNDGDLDLVTNNLNDEVTVLKNNASEIGGHNYIKIKLEGSDKNTAGLGAKIMVRTDSTSIFHEAYFGRGYASSVEPVLTIGIGKASIIREIAVRWPGGMVSTLSDVKPNAQITIKQSQAAADKAVRSVRNDELLVDVTDNSGIKFRHKENRFVDFKGQRLLHYQLSRLGGKMAVADVNNDGNDDIYFGGAAGQESELYFGQDDGTFILTVGQPWLQDAASEDMSALFFDADTDGDKDLYVVSGGSEFEPGSTVYQDRLYLNDGRGKFVKASNALPLETTSGSCVVAADYDKDGDLDLFVGGRHTPGNYSLIPRSYVLENNSKDGVARFIDRTTMICPALASTGMVTAATWTDFNNDTWPDLVIVGEWMPVRVLENVKGKLNERTDIPDLAKSEGWWCSIFPADIDNDGDMDFFLGNAGTNMQFKASEQQPIQMFAGDFNNDGIAEPVLCYYIKGESFPLATRDEMLDQIPALRKKFIKYEDYSTATIHDILTDDQFAKCYKFNAYVLESSWLENVGGKTFKRRPLPALAQLSAVNAFLFDSFDSSTSKQLLMSGNFYPYKPQLGRSDAGKGLFLKFDDGMLKVNSEVVSNASLTGDIRDMALLRFKNGTQRIVVSRNNDQPGIYECKATK